jgi:hypothetical protein
MADKWGVLKLSMSAKGKNKFLIIYLTLPVKKFKSANA